MAPKAGISKASIIQLAMDIADKKGLEEVTIANIAKELKVKSPSLYNHINGLAELKQELTYLALEKLYITIKQATEDKVDAQKTLFALSEAYIEFARKHPGLYSLTVKAPDIKQENMVNLADKIVETIKENIVPFTHSTESTIHAIRGFRSLLHGFAMIEAEKGFGMPIKIDESFHYMVHIYLNGLKEGSEIE